MFLSVRSARAGEITAKRSATDHGEEIVVNG